MNLSTLLPDRAAAEAYLLERTNYERDLTVPYRERTYRLDRMRELLARLGDPHLAIPVVHVTGTKGKGSTSSMIAAALSAAGYRVGLYMSPHLERVEERLLVDGAACPGDDLARLVQRIVPTIDAMDRAAAALDPPEYGPTYFELTTALAWLHFVERQVEIAVLEVGLGGRLDSTNLCRPAITLVTNISFDHTRQLGNTLAAIAGEKAGIFKPGVPAISGVRAPEAQSVILSTAERVGAPLVQLGRDFTYDYTPRVAPTASDALSVPLRDWGRLTFRQSTTRDPQELTDLAIGLPGRHQGANAALAVAALLKLREQGWRMPDEALRAGLADCRCPARVEVVGWNPVTILDTAHNVASLEALLAALDDHFPGRPRRVVFAVSKDKDVRGMLRALLPRCRQLVLTQFGNNSSRAVEVEQLAAWAADEARDLAVPTPGRVLAHVEAVPDARAAWERIRESSTAGDLRCVTGSFFLAGELRPIVMK